MSDYKISGLLEDSDATIVVIDESDWSVETSVSSPTLDEFGRYEITGLTAGKKLVFVRRTAGQIKAYGNVEAVAVAEEAPECTGWESIDAAYIANSGNAPEGTLSSGVINSAEITLCAADSEGTGETLTFWEITEDGTEIYTVNATGDGPYTVSAYKYDNGEGGYTDYVSVAVSTPDGEGNYVLTDQEIESPINGLDASDDDYRWYFTLTNEDTSDPVTITVSMSEETGCDSYSSYAAAIESASGGIGESGYSDTASVANDEFYAWVHSSSSPDYRFACQSGSPFTIYIMTSSGEGSYNTEFSWDATPNGEGGYELDEIATSGGEYSFDTYYIVIENTDSSEICLPMTVYFYDGQSGGGEF
jgi:hypothetical protein